MTTEDLILIIILVFASLLSYWVFLIRKDIEELKELIKENLIKSK